MIPMCDVTAQYQEVQDEINAALCDVAASGQYILGPNVKALESEFAAACQTEHGIGCNSGTNALHLALLALGVGPGDEVITSPFTFVATSEAILMVGATPVFVDIDARTFNIDASEIAEAITERTRAIIPVHLFGQPCDMDAIMTIANENGLAVVEDCAQATGATFRGQPVGSFGDAGCFSFFPSKNLGGIGDGGMITTNSAEVLERVHILRQHGSRKRYEHDELGMNSRLDELQAAVLRIKLRRLSDWNDARRERAWRYNQLLTDSGVTCPGEFSSSGSIAPTSADTTSDRLDAVYHQYTILSENRDAASAAFADAGIGHGIYYSIPLHLQRLHASLSYQPGSLPVCERIAGQCISLPMSPHLTDEQQLETVAVLGTASADRRAA